ncbi:MAG: hypothetical protein AAGB03_05875 [Pseudomonadota bacterium]
MNMHVKSAHAAPKSGSIEDQNETTQLALTDTVLSPRFYTTDFEALDKVNVEGVRAEWDPLLAEMKSDPNRGHFKRNEEWELLYIETLPEDLRREFVDFLVSSLTSEFSGCVLPRAEVGSSRIRTFAPK